MLALLLVVSLAAPLQDSVQGPARTGWEALQRNDGDKAASAFRQALALNPRDPVSLAGSGIAAHLLGRDDQAIAALRRALDLRPGFAYAAMMLGQIAYATGDIDLAISSYERALKTSPTSLGLAQQLAEWKKEAALHDRFVQRPTERFTILFEGPAQHAIAERAADILERAYARVGSTLNAYPSETITAILYTTRQFRDITRAPAWAGGEYDGRIRVPVQGALAQGQELERVMTHEYVHAAIHSLAPRGVPTWLNEGIATYLEPGRHAWLAAKLRAAPRLIPLASLEDGFDQLDGDNALLAYAESAVAAQVLVERLGANFPVFLQYVGNGTPVDQALLLFNIAPDTIEQEWRRRARSP